MKGIIDSKDLPQGEKVYLRKGKFGYRVIHPVNNEDGSKNWVNLLVGGWGNLFKLLFILFVIFCFIYGSMETMKSCRDMAKNPCKYTNLDCSVYSGQKIHLAPIDIDLSEVRDYEQP